MAILRIAVVGVGAGETSRARGYLATVAKLTDHYNLCALCDHNSETVNLVGQSLNVEARYTDVEKMLRAEKPDVVLVLVPTDGQAVVALEAVRHKCNIITEIPYSATLQFGDAIALACHENNVKWEIAENAWRWPHERLKRSIVEAGLIGKINHARLSYATGSYHGFNAIRMILNSEPQRVLGYAQAAEMAPYTNYGGQPETTRWWESGIIEFPEGITCLYEMPPMPGARLNHWEIEGTQGFISGSELVLYRNNERERYPFRDVHEEVDSVKILSAVRVDTAPPIIWENPFKQDKVSAYDDVSKAGILSSLHRAVTEKSGPEYGAINARRDMELCIAIRESALAGSTWLDLPLKGPSEINRRLHDEYLHRYGGDPIKDSAMLLHAQFNRLSVIWTIAGWL